MVRHRARHRLSPAALPRGGRRVLLLRAGPRLRLLRRPLGGGRGRGRVRRLRLRTRSHGSQPLHGVLAVLQLAWGELLAWGGRKLVLAPEELGLGHELLAACLPEALAVADAAAVVLVELLQLLVPNRLDLGVNLLPRGGDPLVRAADHLRGQRLRVALAAGDHPVFNPRMLQGLLGCQALLGIVLEQLLEEADGVGAEFHLRLPLDVLGEDLHHDVPGMFGVVRILAVHDQVQQDTECPNVCHVVVLLAYELGCQVVRGPAQLGEDLALFELASHAKVDHLDGGWPCGRR
mmetsp:Transcript_106995/g.297966  ORF Transcript_106995/g.297966 Transcript_106995/m.297966 type:complete len:291 (-) Transcript_106995:506-1378(-)